MKFPVGKIIALVCLVVLLLGLFMLGVRSLRSDSYQAEVPDYEPWSEEIIETAAKLPVQEGGRIKPFETRAGYALLQMRGDREISILGKNGEEVEIGPVEWMMDIFFRPEVAAKLPSFRIDNSEVLKALGIEFDDNRKKRDRYSFVELAPQFETIVAKAAKLQDLKDQRAELDPVEEQTLELANALQTYFYLSRYFDFIRRGITIPSEEGPDRSYRISEVLEIFGSNVDQGEQRQFPRKLEDFPPELQAPALYAKFNFHPLPPTEPNGEKWSSVGELIEATLTGEVANPKQALADIKRLEELYVAYYQGEKNFAASLEDFRKSMMERGGKEAVASVNRELSFNRIGWFRKGLDVFGIGSLLLILSFFMPDGKKGQVIRAGLWGICSLGLFLVIAGIIHRSLVVMRPPVTNLYETIPFITAGGLILLLLTEVFTKARIALLTAPAVGMAGMVLAAVFEVAAAADSLDPLVAVLRSNFWLSTHVIIITYGYAAGLVGAVLAFVYIFARILGLGDKDFRRSLTRMVYGVTCFTLLLSLIGTVLGGIWANYSWGRFWGWDPKENGALMIVLWSLFILHGRAAGLLREWGVNLMAAFGGVVVTFSWFHVNMLGTGLHSYGFTDGKSAIWVFYGVACGVILIGYLYSQFEKKIEEARKEAAREAAKTPPVGQEA